MLRFNDFNTKSTIHNCSRWQFWFFILFSREKQIDISFEPSAWQMIYMKCQNLFSLKKKEDNFRMLSATNFVWCLRINHLGFLLV